MNESLTILLIEDDDVAAESVRRSLSKMGVSFPVVWADDGVIALGALRGVPRALDGTLHAVPARICFALSEISS